VIRRRRPSAIDFVRIDSEAFHQGFSLLAEDLQYDRSHWARPEQRLPDGDWINWLILAGRGYGKTRGAETVRQWVKRYQYVNLIGATADDVRDIMITGESGILAVCPKDARPRYIANKRMLAWPNGAISLLFTAEEPDRFRGKQHEKLWPAELRRRPQNWPRRRRNCARKEPKPDPDRRALRARSAPTVRTAGRARRDPRTDRTRDVPALRALAMARAGKNCGELDRELEGGRHRRNASRPCRQA
jgi:hypothetical protein